MVSRQSWKELQSQPANLSLQVAAAGSRTIESTSSHLHYSGDMQQMGRPQGELVSSTNLTSSDMLWTCTAVSDVTHTSQLL